ncbi:nickel/cobalt ABC transporter permease [Oribacterium sp.]
MGKRFVQNKMAMGILLFLLLLSIVGIFAPFFAPHDPYETNIIQKFAPFSLTYPLGTDQLGRCILSRLIYGIRPTLFLSLLTMVGTIFIGTLMGVLSGYFRGPLEEVIMRLVDVMLSFPSQIMVFAVVALLGVDVRNVILANVFIKWAWYARMIRTNVLKYKDKNYILYSRSIGNTTPYIIVKHLIPAISSELAVLATLDMGWAILNISTLSFLGLGVQAPTPEWGAMLNEAKNVMTTNPVQMLAPGIAIVLVVASFNFLGDALRDAFDPKEAMA